MSYEDFRKVGRLGCAECYGTFKRSLGSLLKRIHGSPIHLGKAPVRSVRPAKTKSELADLKRKLEEAIDGEAFDQPSHSARTGVDIAGGLSERGRTHDREE